MTAPSLGSLTNPEPWRQMLPPELSRALEDWVRLEPFQLTHRCWIGGGQSGSYLALVVIRPHRGRLQGAVIKLAPPEQSDEMLGLRTMMDHTPAAFRDLHLVATERLDWLANGWQLQLQKVAQVDASTLVPLASQVDHPEFARFCGLIVESVVNDWKRDDDPAPLVTTLNDFVKANTKLVQGLHEFARLIDMDVDRPPRDIRVPGRADELPNPLYLLAHSGRDPVEIFVGNGHGDLNLHNVLVPLTPHIDAERYLLVDTGRFSPTMPVSRDPMKLLLCVGQHMLTTLATDTAVRSAMAEVIVRPEGIAAPLVARGFQEVARRVHASAESWAVRRRVASEWPTQNLVVLLETALRTTARPELSLAERWWTFEVAAVAARELVRSQGPGEGGSGPKPRSALPPPGPIANLPDRSADPRRAEGHSMTASWLPGRLLTTHPGVGSLPRGRRRLSYLVASLTVAVVAVALIWGPISWPGGPDSRPSSPPSPADGARGECDGKDPVVTATAQAQLLTVEGTCWPPENSQINIYIDGNLTCGATPDRHWRLYHPCDLAGSLLDPGVHRIQAKSFNSALHAETAYTLSARESTPA